LPAEKSGIGILIRNARKVTFVQPKLTPVANLKQKTFCILSCSFALLSEMATNESEFWTSKMVASSYFEEKNIVFFI
jgi:hypothetical protein